MLTICTIISIGIPSINCDANVTSLTGGLYVEHLGEANIARGALQLDIKIPWTDLAIDEHNINVVKQNITTMCNKGKNITSEVSCNDLVNHLHEFAEEVLQKINSLKFMKFRTKRGLFGSLLTALFGVNDEVIEDVNTLAENQKRLKEAWQQESKIILKATKVMNSTSDRINSQLQRFSDQLSEGLACINKFSRWYIITDHNKINLQFLSTYQKGLNFIQEVFNKYSNILNAVTSKSNIWDCIKLAELEILVNKTQTILPVHIKILHISTEPLHIMYDEIFLNIIGHLPIIDDRNFDLIKATAIPHWHGGKTFSAFDITTSVYGINYNDQTYFETEESNIFEHRDISTNKYILHIPTLIDMTKESNCVIKELYSSNAKNDCPTHTFKVNSLTWKHLANPNSWMFVTPEPVSAQTVCKGQRSEIMLNGTGIVRLSSHCILYSKQFILYSEKVHKGNQFPVYIKLKSISVETDIQAQDIPLLNTSTVVKADETFTSVLLNQQEFTSSFANVQLKTLREHSTITVLGFGIIGIIIFCIMSIAFYYCTRKTELVNITPTSSSSWYAEHQI
jgi:hypothetical protein